MNNDAIYITGHQHPDTDSIASAIAYAFFKKAKGIKAIPCRLGPVNNETAYLLKRFGFDEPYLLKDARKTLSEITMDSPEYITKDTTVLETIRKMHELDRNSFAVLDDDMKLAGYVSKSDLANIGLSDTAAEIELLRQTPVEDIAKSIDGIVLYTDAETHINGKVSIIALNASKTEHYDVHDRIVICGHDPEAFDDLIRKGAGMLIIVWPKEIPQSVIDTAKQYHCPVIVSGHGTMNTSRYLFLSPPVHLIMTRKPIVFRNTEYAEDARLKMMKSRFRSYPVLDEENHLIGYVSRYHILNHKPRKLILVDHNEFSQSVRHVESGQILEVIDHHRISDFATTQPVSFRSEIIGSSATIIATMFRENQILLTKEMAGLLLGAILSDTLVFQSPTTTEKDRECANILAALSDLDIDTFANEMFTASASGENQTIREMIVQDIKFYEIEDTRCMISQVIISLTDHIRNRENEIMTEMNKLVKSKDLDLLVVAFTSVLEDGSVFYAAGEKAPMCLESFYGNTEEHTLVKGVFSRKKQILPKITEILQGN
ncbi:MAG: putative manganese-dependent inorganic diphosphatase [Solobacterium sp.]|nr:putative manganese-dependent inorganic diphosphatase [Solobacterium sp.]